MKFTQLFIYLIIFSGSYSSQANVYLKTLLLNKLTILWSLSVLDNLQFMNVVELQYSS